MDRIVPDAINSKRFPPPPRLPCDKVKTGSVEEAASFRTVREVVVPKVNELKRKLVVVETSAEIIVPTAICLENTELEPSVVPAE